MEHLKQIEGYEDYFVSDQGNVYSNKFNKMKKLKLQQIGGYLKVILCNKGNKKQMAVHRLVAQAFVLNPENKPCVNHLDGNKQNNNVDNLEWCTQEENIQYFYNVQKPLGQYEILDEEHREEINARARRWREEHREEILDYKRRWCEEHREEIKAYRKRYRKKHREEINARQRRYREEHKNKK